MAIAAAFASPPSHQADRAVREWLETQAHILAYWREVLVSANGSDGLIEALDDHARFLAQAARSHEGGFTSYQ